MSRATCPAITPTINFLPLSIPLNILYDLEILPFLSHSSHFAGSTIMNNIRVDNHSLSNLSKSHCSSIRLSIFSIFVPLHLNLSVTNTVMLVGSTLNV